MIGSSGKIYVFEGVQIDAGRVVVRRGGNEYGLRPKSFLLLLYLLENRNRLVPKEELIEQLWPETAVSDGALARCVMEIRRTLGEDPRNPRFIRTAARLGYQFIGSVEEEPTRSLALPETSPALAMLPEDEPEADPGPVQTNRFVAHTSAPAQAGGRILLLIALAAVGITAAVAAWHNWGGPPAAAKEPQWWEVAWWKFDERTGPNIRDLNGGLSAPLPAGVSWVQGISGSALLFTGRESVHGNDRGWVLPSGLTPRTLTAWVKVKVTNGDLTPVFGLGDIGPDSPPGSTFALALHESGTAGFGTGHFTLAGNSRIDDDRWHQLTGVFDGGESRGLHVFVDGIEQASTKLQFTLTPANVSRWTIGTAFDGSTIWGTVDDARVYGRALRPQEIRSLYRCIVGETDIDRDGSSYYFAPIFGNSVEILSRQPGDESAPVRNTGNDFGGVMFVRREASCSLRSIHGADMGQDLTIDAELRVPTGSGGTITEGGPYFRSRPANPGDGIIGGTSAGFWVRLDSTGQVRVQRLHPNAVLALSEAPEHFDPGIFHRLVATARGDTLEGTLDGQPLTFDVGGVRKTVLRIQPVWETALPKGNNGGSAGIAFGCSSNRTRAGGQEARNIRIHVPLASLLVPESSAAIVP